MPQAPTTSQLPYRPGVGIMLINADNNVFVARRIDTTAEAWQMPQGGIDEGEEPYECALRELKEETGVSQAALIGESKDWLCYDLPDELIPQIWGGRYRGQRQKWFLMRLEAGDDHINIATEEPEFLDWKWVQLDEVPQLIVPFKRTLYHRLVEEFRPFLEL